MGSIKPYKTLAFICITDSVSVNMLTTKIGGLGPCCSFFSLGPVLVQSVCFRGCTLRKTNSSRLKIGLFTHQKEINIFIPIITFQVLLLLPSRKLTYPPKIGTFEDGFPFPKVGYVNSLEGSFREGPRDFDL